MLFTESQLRGQLAMWVARQSPHRSVAGVDAVGDLITAATKASDWFGPDDCRMREFEDWRSLERWIRGVVGEHPQLIEWNTPRSGHGDNVFVSRHNRPHPDYDFIDIDALLRNIALCSWRESEVEASIMRRIDAEIADSN